MPLPKTLANSLGKTIPLAPPLTRTAASITGVGGGGGGGTLSWSLGFRMQPQQQTNWCWAAVSASTHQFYSPGSPIWSQCDVANACLGQTTCCIDGSSSACNVPWYLDRALTAVGHFASMSAAPDPVATLQTELAARHPIGCRVGWSGGGGHFVAIDGLTLAPTGNVVTIQDPIYGTSSMDYALFLASYQGSGTWTHTYHTQP